MNFKHFISQGAYTSASQCVHYALFLDLRELAWCSELKWNSKSIKKKIVLFGALILQTILHL